MPIWKAALYELMTIVSLALFIGTVMIWSQIMGVGW